MAAQRSEIEEWLHSGDAAGATHMIVVCDTFNYEDYPVYVQPDKDVFKEIARFDEVNMQRVVEVYNLSQDIGAQLNEVRAWHP